MAMALFSSLLLLLALLAACTTAPRPTLLASEPTAGQPVSLEQAAPTAVLPHNADFIALPLLGRPTATSVTANVVPADAARYGYVKGTLLGGSGYLRIRVAPEGVTVDYVRAYLPQEQDGQRSNGMVGYSYTLGR